MENIEKINKKIEEYRKGVEKKVYWKNKEIKIDINITEKSFTVNGFGICENDNFEESNFRYYLEFDINNPLEKKGTIVSIMMNPSDKTNPENNLIDSTVTNVIKMAYVSGYSKVIILNSFPYINGNGKESLNEKNNSEDKNKLNREFIYEFLKENVNNVDILLAWGGQIKNTIADFNEVLKPYNTNEKIYVYDITADKFPMHPSPYNEENVQNAINDGKNCFKKVTLLTGNRRKKIGVAIKKY